MTSSGSCSYILCRVEYNGSKYGGWQRQGKVGNNVVRLTSVQAKIEEAFTQLYQDTNNSIICVQVSGRTDKGTHALDQVCVFRVPTFAAVSFSSTQLNETLPEDIQVIQWSIVPSSTLRQVVVKKKYVYVIHYCPALPVPGNTTSRQHNYVPSLKHVSWYCCKPLDVDSMRTAIDYFIGTHDFQYVSNEAGRVNTTRTMSHTKIYQTKDLPLQFIKVPNPTSYAVVNETCENENNHSTSSFIVMEFIANGFLQHQVRRMVAILKCVGEGLWPPEMVQGILQGEEYKLPASAPSRGLYLSNVWLEGD